MITESLSTPGQKVYYHRYRWPSFALYLFLTADGIVLLSTFSNTIGRVGAGILILTAAVLAIYWLRTRIVISSAGIAYHTGLFYTINAGWDAVERIDAKPSWTGMSSHSLILGELAGSNSAGTTSEKKKKIIPISDWQHSDELLNEIQGYAPRLAA